MALRAFGILTNVERVKITVVAIEDTPRARRLSK